MHSIGCVQMQRWPGRGRGTDGRCNSRGLTRWQECRRVFKKTAVGRRASEQQTWGSEGQEQGRGRRQGRAPGDSSCGARRNAWNAMYLLNFLALVCCWFFSGYGFLTGSPFLLVCFVQDVHACMSTSSLRVAEVIEPAAGHPMHDPW